MKKDRRIAKNVLVGGMCQVIAMALSLFIPRLMIVSYGSDVNGLVSTVSQAFAYLALLEYGIGAATVNRLYKDIATEDGAGINYTLSATRSYFYRLIPIYAACVLGFVLLFPYIIKTNVSPFTIRMIILVQGTSGIVNFAFTNTYRMLINADGRNYVQTLLNLMMRLINTIGQIVLINSGYSVVLVQCVALLATVVNAIAVQTYVRRQYPNVKLSWGVSPKILEQKGAFFIHELSAVIFLSTDVFVIGVCCGTAVASIYAIYQLIYHSLNSILTIFENGVNFKLGHIYNGARERYERFHDAYEAAYSALVFAFMTVTLYLTLPFVALYTEGVSDAVYVDKYLPLLFALIQLLTCSRMTCVKLISVAGHAKNTVVNTVLESVINLTVSILLARKIGIYGVLIGTVVALLYRSNDIICYANFRILKRKPLRSYITHGVYYVLFVLNYLLSRAVDLNIRNYAQFLLWGVLLTGAMLLLYGAAMLMLSSTLRTELKERMAVLKKRG